MVHTEIFIYRTVGFVTSVDVNTCSNALTAVMSVLDLRIGDILFSVLSFRYFVVSVPLC